MCTILTQNSGPEDPRIQNFQDYRSLWSVSGITRFPIKSACLAEKSIDK